MKTLKKFEFASAANRATYDWNKLLDGGIYELTQGEDFTCSIASFEATARDRAARLGYKLNVSKTETTITIQRGEERPEGPRPAWKPKSKAEGEANGAAEHVEKKGKAKA